MLKWIGEKWDGAQSAVGRLVLGRIGRKWADGKLGAGPTRVYYFLSAQSGTITAILAALAGMLLAAAQMPDLLALVGLTAEQVTLWSTWLAYIAPLLVSLKLATDQWHSVTPAGWMDSAQARWLKRNSALITVAFGVAWFYAEGCGQGGWCDAARWALFALGVVGANFGILPSAARAIPPTEVLRALAGLVDPQTPRVEAQAVVIDEHPEALELKGALADVAERVETLQALGSAEPSKLATAGLAGVARALKV